MLAGLAGCGACHTAEGGAPYAGGYELETRFGTFRGTNLTPDPEHGLGGWSFEDFERAMRRGRSPEGHAYWPVFPYASFTRLGSDDLADLWAYLQTLPPSPTPDPEQDPGPPGVGLWAWRLIAFRKGDWEPLPDPELDRGGYLVEVVGHCGDCHTRRTGIGTVRKRQRFAGNEQPPHPGPNVTPHPDGIGDWSEDDLTTFLQLGMEPDGDFSGGGMRHVIRDGTSKLTDADRLAMARYLRSLEPLPTPEAVEE